MHLIGITPLPFSIRLMLRLTIVLLICSCSFAHRVLVENASEATVSITYKIRPASWQHGLFAQRPVAWRKQGKDMVADTTIRMNPTDSLIAFTLGPGEEALLGHCMNCTLEVLTTHGGTDPWADSNGNSRLNLYWMRIEQQGNTTTYTPTELVAMATKNTTSRTLLRLK